MLEARPFWMKAECHYQDLTVAPFFFLKNPVQIPIRFTQPQNVNVIIVSRGDGV